MSQALRTAPAPRISAEVEHVTQEPMGVGLVPRSMDEAIRLAKAMASARLMPEHFKDDVGSALMVVEQAMRWRMSPFAVAQCTSLVKNKLMYEGKLVAAAIETSGAIEGLIDYTFAGSGAERTVTVSATRRGEREPRTITIRLADVKTNNEWWTKQPDQQLVYSGARNWARRWTPAVMLGVYSPDEFGRDVTRVVDTFNGKTIEANASTDDADVAETKAPSPAPAPESKPASTPAPNGNGKRTLRNVLDALKLAIKDAETEEDLDNLARTDDYRKVMEAAPEAARNEITDAVTAHLADIRHWVAVENGWDPDTIDNAPEHDAGPDADRARYEAKAAEIMALGTLQALDKTMKELAITALLVEADKLRRPELAALILDAEAQKRQEIRLGG
jgi:hypothetical protein